MKLTPLERLAIELSRIEGVIGANATAVKEFDATLLARQAGDDTFWDRRSWDDIEEERAECVARVHKLVEEKAQAETFYRAWAASLARWREGHSRV